MHELNIIHRDIKIENILTQDFSEDTKIRIADLGSSIRLNSPDEKVNFKIGTPGYIAPEILKGEPYSFAVDVWSLGCLLHVLLCATPPFWDDERSIRNKKVCEEQLDLESNQFLCSLSDSCKSLLHLMLCKDPKKRPTIR